MAAAFLLDALTPSRHPLYILTRAVRLHLAALPPVEIPRPRSVLICYAPTIKRACHYPYEKHNHPQMPAPAALFDALLARHL
jgi:hypothetical protein